MAEDVVLFVNVLAAALLVGNEIGTWAVVHPALAKLPFDRELPAEQEVTRRYGYFMPALMLTAVISGFAAAALAGGETGSLLLVASLLLSAMLAITLAGNVPLNARTLSFGVDADPAEWRAIRRRWDRLHTLRVALDIAAFTCIAVAHLS